MIMPVSFDNCTEASDAFIFKQDPAMVIARRVVRQTQAGFHRLQCASALILATNWNLDELIPAFRKVDNNGGILLCNQFRCAVA